MRTLIHVAGPSGSGKTTFAEAVFAGIDEMILGARCVRDDSLTELRESDPRDDPELRRYHAAFAYGTARISFSGAAEHHHAFFQTSFMENYSDGALLEGDSPVDYCDVEVYVAPVGGELLVRRTRDLAAQRRAVQDSMEAVLSHPDGMRQVLRQLVGIDADSIAKLKPSTLEAHRVAALKQVKQLRRQPDPQPEPCWAIAEEYQGIEAAQLVVVNVRDGSQRERAEALVAGVAQLRKDPEVFADVMGPRGHRIPVTAVVADLANPKDPGTRKALARVKRAFRLNDG